MAIDLEKYRKAPGVDLSKYKKKPQTSGQTFDVPENPQASQNRLAAAQADQAKYDAAAKRANSIGGFAANFGKAFIKNIAPSEVNLGKTISMLGGPDQGRIDSAQSLADSQVELLKTISENQRKGIDTTKMKQVYNDNAKVLKGHERYLSDYQASLPSNLEAAGQIGGTALDVLSAGSYSKAARALPTGQLGSVGSNVAKTTATAAGVPEVGALAGQQARGLFTRQGAKNIATGAGLGYASDVTLGLQGERGENRTGEKAFIPGLGTAFGATIPTANEAYQTGKNLFDPETKANNLIKNRRKALDQLDTYKQITTATEKGRERGINIKDILAETDVLHGSVDTDGRIATLGDGGAVEQYTKQFIDGNESLVGDLIKREGVSISPDVVKQKLKQAVLDAGIEGRDLQRAYNKIDDELAGYAMRAGTNGTVPVSTLHQAKIDKYSNINYLSPNNTKKYDKTVAKALKELVEDNTKSVDIKALNGDLSKHFAVIDYLRKLDGKRVKGGRLGKYFGQTIGAVVGSHFGPLGAVAGVEAGGLVRGGQMARVFRGKTGKNLPKSQVIQNAENIRDAAPLQLPGQSSSFNRGSLNNSQSPTNITTNTKGITSTLPRNRQGAMDLSPNDLFERKTTGQRVSEALKDKRGSINPQPLKDNPFSSVNYNRLSPQGEDVVIKFLGHMDGTQKLSAAEWRDIQAAMLTLANAANFTSKGGTNAALAKEAADRYQKVVANWQAA